MPHFQTPDDLSVTVSTTGPLDLEGGLGADDYYYQSHYGIQHLLHIQEYSTIIQSCSEG